MPHLFLILKIYLIAIGTIFFIAMTFNYIILSLLVITLSL